jgi:nicotinamide mononucleotide transporter PnuC
VASLVGVTALIFYAKGNPVGQALMVVFCLLYAWISYSFRYYGELLTYMGMTFPMAVLSLIQWLRHPYAGKKDEVEMDRLRPGEWRWIAAFAVAVTAVFFFLLLALGTANLIPGTVSVTTSFVASYLTYRRNPWLSVWYAANDVVLIVLWVLASLQDRSYLSVVMCFAVFLVNDLYCFISLRSMARKQRAGK